MINIKKNFPPWIIKYLVLSIILYFLINQNVYYFSQIKSTDLLSINWFLIGLAVIIQTISFFFQAYLWHNLMLLFNMKLKASQSIFIWVKSQFAKYLPGMVWVAVGRAILVNNYNFNKKKLSLIIIIELILLIALSLIIGGLILLLY